MGVSFSLLILTLAVLLVWKREWSLSFMKREAYQPVVVLDAKLNVEHKRIPGAVYIRTENPSLSIWVFFWFLAWLRSTAVVSIREHANVICEVNYGIQESTPATCTEI